MFLRPMRIAREQCYTNLYKCGDKATMKHKVHARRDEARKVDYVMHIETTSKLHVYIHIIISTATTFSAHIWTSLLYF